MKTLDPHSLSAWAAAFFLASCLFSHTVALRLMMLAAGAGLCTWALWKGRGAIRGAPPIWPIFALWAAWAALSIGWSEDAARSVKEFRNEFAYTGIALWMCYVAAQARQAGRAIAVIVGTAAVGFCILSLYNFAIGLEASAHGFYAGPGTHSSIVLFLMPCALLMAWYAMRVGLARWICASGMGLALLLAASAYATLNRTVWLGFAAQALLILCLLPARTGGFSTRHKLAVAILAAAIPAAALAMTWIVHAERVAAGAPSAIEKDARAIIWPEALELAEERPFTGYGVGRGMLRRTLQSETGDGLAWHAHNLFLDTVLQMGLPGLALLLLLLAAILREARRLAWTGDPISLACGAALAALVVGMLVRNMTDLLWVRQTALLFWGLTGVLLGLAARLRKQ